MPPKDVLEIVSGIADALDYAHERYLLHRDVKPANILITDTRNGDRRILLADFGIARGANDIHGLTATNVTVGSVAYAAPEQLTGKAIDGRADQYALACTAFHLLTGGPPFVNSNPAVVIGSHLSSPAPRLGSLRSDLGPIDDALAKAMAKEPFQRFDSCSDFAAALTSGGVSLTGPSDATQLATNIPASARAGTAPEPTSGSGSGVVSLSRRTALIAISIAGLLAVGLVAFIGARLAQQQSSPPIATPPRSSSISQASQPPGPPETVPRAAPPVTVTSPVAPPPRSTPSQSARYGDLRLTMPMSYPSCNGQGIVVLGSVTTPGLYAAGVQRLLDAHPGAFYLRTDQTCPSLRQATEEGNPIYAVFELSGANQGAVCAAVRAAGGIAYGKWLDTTTDPGYIIPC
jgi:serine/threonine-protein kinase